MATIEQNKFGVVIKFPNGAYLDKAVYKLLVSNGFVKSSCLNFNHWKAEATGDRINVAGQIVALFNSPTRRYERIYPKSKAA